MRLLLLHLSDIHLKSNQNSIIQRVEEIAVTLFEVLPDARALFIVVTGDIAYSGKSEEYYHARQFLTNIIAYISEYSTIPIHTVMVPGNHDGEFKDAGNGRRAIIEKVREEGVGYIDDDIIEKCTAPQKQYFEFEQEFEKEYKVFSDPLWKEYQFEIDDRKINFSAINASWMSQVPEEQGKLVFPVKKYSTLSKTEASIRIILLHHPLNWYAQESYHPLRELCRTQYQIVMTGHEHTNSANLTIDTSNHQSVHLEAGALVPDVGDESTFAIVTLDLDKKRFANEVFKWDGKSYLPANGGAVWDTFLPLPESRPNNFQLTDEMKLNLESLGATFSHPNIAKLSLSDVFVYPDLMEIDPNDADAENVNSEILTKQIESLEKVLIFGDDQFGKTSLLNHLYKQYYDIGLIPVLFEAQDLAKTTEDQFLKLIKRNVEKQYGLEAVTKFSQTPNKSKIALVDNIDKVGVRGDILSRITSNLSKHFKFLIYTAGDRFDVTVLSSAQASEAVTSFKNFRLLGFGYRLRNDLIRRWYQIGSDLSNDELQEKLHNSEQVINSILGKGLVPMTAFNVLVLLQTIEVNQKTALANAGLAQYYEFLIRRSLFDAKIKSEELDEVLSYLSHLAWEMYEKSLESITEEELTAFNTKFSNQVHKTSLIERLDTLLLAKVLGRREEGYYFAYKYLSYFFVAKYFAEHLEDDEALKLKVIHICHHLYLKNNANIILFLTHHTNSRWIIKEVASVLGQLLRDVSPLNLKTDTELINTWVSETARVAIDTSNLMENQKKIRSQDDAADQYEEDEPTCELSSVQELDQLSQLNLLFKTSEILGQILKGRYGSMTKELKNELLIDLFEAPLRAVNFFLGLVNSVPDALLIEIGDRMQKKVPSTVDREKIDRAAKRFIFAIVGSVADSFLSRQGDIIGSPKLKDSIDELTSTNGGLSYSLVSISAQLSYPNHAPIEQIKKLADDLEKNYFGFKVLQGLAARHMYMYSLSPKARHSLASAVSIDIQSQLGIEMRSHGSKKLRGTQIRSAHPKSLIIRLRDSFMANNETIHKTMERYKKVPKDTTTK